MQHHVIRITFAALFVVALGVGAQAATCTQAAAAGDWGFSYTGAALTPSASIPIVSAGRYAQDASGNMVGTELRNLAGMPSYEVIKGKFSVRADCTVELRANVYEAGQLVRISVIDGVLLANETELRAVFQSVVLPDGTILPVVITIEGKKLFTPGME